MYKLCLDVRLHHIVGQFSAFLRTVDYGGGAKSIMLPNLDFCFLQYCAKVMRAKFVELRCFSVLFNGIQRIFERNDMSTKYSRNIMPSIVLTQSELSGSATKSRSASSEFSNEDNEFSY